MANIATYSSSIMQYSTGIEIYNESDLVYSHGQTDIGFYGDAESVMGVKKKSENSISADGLFFKYKYIKIGKRFVWHTNFFFFFSLFPCAHILCRCIEYALCCDFVLLGPQLKSVLIVE